MKISLLSLLSLAAGLSVGCDSGKEAADAPSADPSESKTPAVIHSAPAPSPTPEVRAALEAQTIGSKLLGNTVLLNNEAFEPADLLIAPEAYFVYYSASW